MGDSRIVGGRDAADGQFPYQISLRAATSGRHFCGGTILTGRFVITAAHCTVNSSPTSMRIAVGSVNVNSGTIYDVMAVINHQQFNMNNISNDIALLKTVDAIRFTEFVQPIPISTTYVGDGEQAVASGWGQTTNPGSVPNTLQFLTVRSISNKSCARQHSALNSAMIYDASICTFPQKNEGLCMGDSGGPLVKDGQLIGIVSWGIPCARGRPDVFTRVSAFALWVQNTIAEIPSV